MAADQEPGLGRGGDPRQGMVVAQPPRPDGGPGRRPVVPPHHLGALVLKGLEQKGHQGLQRQLEQTQDGPGGPGIDGHFRGLCLGQQVPGLQGQGLTPAGNSLTTAAS